MKIIIAVLLILISVFWLLGILMFYGDSMMTIENTVGYTLLCVLMIFLAIF